MLFLMIILLLCFSGLIFGVRIFGGVLGLIVSLIPHADEQGKKGKKVKKNKVGRSKEAREAHDQKTAELMSGDVFDYICERLETEPKVTIHPSEINDTIRPYLFDKLDKSDLVLGLEPGGVIIVKSKATATVEEME